MFLVLFANFLFVVRHIYDLSVSEMINAGSGLQEMINVVSGVVPPPLTLTQLPCFREILRCWQAARNPCFVRESNVDRVPYVWEWHPPRIPGKV